MRLLNVYNLSFHAFKEHELPPYAIASHRWEEEEVSFAEVYHKQNTWKMGFRKVADFCQFVRQRNQVVKQCSRSQELKEARLEWIWIDTCCINKESSEEVKYDVTSMYKYYEKAAECYAYLSDVNVLADFPHSKWFTRGWTLQELIAPQTVTFLSRG